MKETVVELFAGVGGFRVGLNNVQLIDNIVIENGDWDFVWTNQWEPSTKVQDAYNCYVQRFGESDNHSNQDISTVDKSSIPDHTLLVGGFPCQDYSVARSLSGEKGIDGKKGVLWWEIAEILKVKQPPFVLLENVDRLLKSPSTQRGRDFGIMLKTFAQQGYSVEWRVINAADYGMPQRRRRVFIFAFHKSTNYYKTLSKHESKLKEHVNETGLFAKCFPVIMNNEKEKFTDISNKNYNDLVEMTDKFNFLFENTGLMYKDKVFTKKTTPMKTKKEITLLDIIEKEKIDEKYFINPDKLEKWKYLKGSKRIERKKPNGDTYFFSEGKMEFPDSLNKPGRTMLTSETSVNRSSHVIKDYVTNKLRTITPIEAERLNCFPDNWTNTEMTERKRYFMMGNALVTSIVAIIGEELDLIINNE